MNDLTRAMAFVSALPIINMKPDELAHHGVLGMKWGRRKSESSSVKKAASPKKVPFKDTEKGTVTTRKYPATASSDHVQSRELKAKKTHELSNAEIEKIVQSLQKEQNLKRVDPSAVDRGKKITLGIIAAAGTGATVYNLIHSPAGQAAVKRGSQVVQAILLRRIA